MSESSRLVKNTAIIAIGNMGTKVISFFLLPLYTGILTTQEYGTYDYVTSLASFIAPILSILVSESMFRFLIDANGDNSKKREIISESLIIVLGGCLVCFAGTLLLSIFITYKYLWYLCVYCVVTILAWQMPAILRGIGKMAQFALYSFLTSATLVALDVITIAWLRLGLKGLFLSFFISQLLWLVIFAFADKMWGFISFSAIRTDGIKKILNYSIPMVPNKLSWSIVDVSDRIIVTNILGAGENGIYSVAYKFPNLVNTFYSFFYAAWTESSARVLNESKEFVDNFYNKVYDRLLRIMSAIVMLLLSGMPIIFKLMINKQFSAAYVYVPLLVIGMFFSNVAGIYGGVFSAYKNTKILGYSTMIAALINVVINIALISIIGLYAAAFSTLISNLVVALIRRIQVRQYVTFNKNWKFMIAFAVTLLFVLLCYYRSGFYCTVFSIIFVMVFSIWINRILITEVMGKVLIFIKK